MSDELTHVLTFAGGTKTIVWSKDDGFGIMDNYTTIAKPKFYKNEEIANNGCDICKACGGKTEEFQTVFWYERRFLRPTHWIKQNAFRCTKCGAEQRGRRYRYA